MQSLATKLPADDQIVHTTFANLRTGRAHRPHHRRCARGCAGCSSRADLRFDRQGWELTVPVEVTDGDRPRIEGLEERFKAEYPRRFGQGAIAMGVPVELMTLPPRSVPRSMKTCISRSTRRPRRTTRVRGGVAHTCQCEFRTARGDERYPGV